MAKTGTPLTRLALVFYRGVTGGGMGKKHLSIERAISFIDAHRGDNERPGIEAIIDAVERVNKLIDDEYSFGEGTQSEQVELFEHLVSISRKRKGVRSYTFILPIMILKKWAAFTRNLYGVAYRTGHDDGNANGAFHTNKRVVLKVAKRISVKAKASADARHDKPGNSRDKRKAICAIWASGKFSSRDLCAEQECAGLDMSYSTARKALINTPEPI